MTGIAGHVTFAGELPSHVRVAQLADGLHGEPRHRCLASIESGAFAHQALIGGAACVARDGGGTLLAAVDGEILGEEVAAAAELVLERYQRLGDRFVEGLHGAFAAALWDDRRRVLLLASDPFGLRPLYWRAEPLGIRFASTVRALLPTGAVELDEQAIAGFLVFGFPLFERTFVRGVELVPAGTVLTFTKHGSRTWRYWQPSAEPPDSRHEDGGRVAEALATFRACFLRMTPEPGPFAVPLSGGLDSRCIAAALRERGKPGIAFTIGSEGVLDLSIAATVAERLAMPHRALVLHAPDCLSWIADGVRLAEGMCSAFDTHILAIARELPVEVRVALDGTIPADCFHSLFHVWLHRFFGRGYGRVRQMRWFLSQPLLDDAGHLAHQDLFAARFRQVVQRQLANDLDALQDSVPVRLSSPFERAAWLLLTQRCRRYNAIGTTLLRSRVEVRHPFFDPRLADLLRRAPVGLRGSEKILIGRMLNALAPDLADIPYERTGHVPGTGPLPIALVYALRIFDRSILPKLFPEHRPRWRGQSIDYRTWLAEDPALQRFVRDVLLDPAALGRGWFDPAALTVLVEQHLRGAGDNVPLLGRLISFELWQRSLDER